MSAASVRLRAYRPADLDAMYALDTVCFEPAFCFSRSTMRRFAQAKKARVAIAEAEKTLAGFAILHVEGRLGYVVTLDVDPSRRRRGLAGFLMDDLELQALQARCIAAILHVSTRNDAAIQFYERRGYSLVGTQPGFYGPGLDALVYRKLLVPQATVAAQNLDR